MNEYRKKAIIYLVIASVLWSTGGLFIKLVHWHPLAIAGARSGIAALVMLIYLRKPNTNFSKNKVLAACCYASLLILFVSSNKLTTSANAILLQFTSPIWVALFSMYFLKEKITKSDWIVIITVMFGMAFFFLGDLKCGNMVGNILAIFAGVAFAGFIIFLKLLNENSPVEIPLLGNLITFTVGLPFFFLSMPDLQSIFGLLMLGIFQTGISYIFYVKAVKYVSSLEAILIPFLEPLLNPVWVFLFVGESPSFYALIGGLIVISAVVFKELFHKS